MKKLLKNCLLIVALLILCGCDATYKIEINDDAVKDNLKILETNTEVFDKIDDNGWTLRESFEALMSKDEFSKNDYSIKSLNNSTQLGASLSSSVLLSNLSNLQILNQCYGRASITNNDGMILIDTGDNFQCFEYYEYLQNVTVEFTTNHKVNYTNSDEKENGKYIWHLTKDGNQQIIINFSEKDVKNKINYGMYGVILLVICIIGIIAYMIYKKHNEANNM